MMPHRFTRRVMLAVGIAMAGLAAVGQARAAGESPAAFRIGYQKTGPLVVLKQQGTLTERLARQGTAVQWVEFQSGPPMMEALNAGAIDFAYTGDTPPIFAQAAGTDFVYVGSLPSPSAGAAILVHDASPIRSLSDLKGKRVGFTKGSSAHNVVVRALRTVGLDFRDIKPVYLQPADAASAFRNGSLDAWSIWDPFTALAEREPDVRVLTTAKGIAESNSFLLAPRAYATRYPGTIHAAIEEVAAASQWAKQHQDELAAVMAAITGVDIGAQRVAAARGSYDVRLISDEVIAQQQGNADTFFQLGLIPRAINIRAAAWTPNS